MKLEEEWAQWESDFRSAPRRTIDATVLNELIKKSQRKTLLARVDEVGSLVFGRVTFGVLLTRTPAIWPIASLCMAGLFAMLLHATHVRSRTTTHSPTIASYVSLELDRKRKGLKIHKVGVLFQGLFTVAFGLWLPYFLMTTREAQGANVPWLVVRLVFAAVALPAVWLYLLHKGTKLEAELKKLETVQSELSDVPATEVTPPA